VSSKERDFYTKQLANLEQRLATVSSDLESATFGESWLTLTKRSDQLLAQIEEIDSKLKELDSENPDLNVRDRSLEKMLQKIDFVEAKKTAAAIKDKLSKDGGSVLLFLQKSKKQMGHYCVEEVINVIMGDQIVGGEIIGAYRRYSIDLGSAISQYNETEFLIRLASHFNVEESTDLVALSQSLREKIRLSIDSGTTIFIEIKSLDELLEQKEFLRWFITEFWGPLINEVVTVSRNYKSKFIVALVADSQILPDCPPDYFCSDAAFDCYKMLELPLPNWTIEDIHDWLVRFRTSLPKMKTKEVAELKQVAKKIHRDSEGTPESVCVSLREKFL